MCLQDAKEMGHGYSLLCQGMFPIQSFIKCFYSGGTCAKRHSAGVISKSCCLDKTAICNGQNSASRNLHHDDIFNLRSTTSSVCLKQPETVEKPEEEGVLASPPSEEGVQPENCVMVQCGVQPDTQVPDTPQPARVFRPPIMAALKSNPCFNSSLEGTDLDPVVPNESPRNLQNRAIVKAAFQNLKVPPTERKTQRVSPSAYPINSTILCIDTDAKTPSPKRSNAGGISNETHSTRRTHEDVEAGNAQNLCDTDSNTRHRQQQQQRSLVRQNLLCIGSQDLPETLHATTVGADVQSRNSTSFLANGSVFTVITDHYTPPMDGILGSLGRNNRLMIEARLHQNGDVRPPKSGGTVPTSGVVSSAGKVESKAVKDGKMRWQESVTSVSKNLRVIMDELHKLSGYTLEIRFNTFYYNSNSAMAQSVVEFDRCLNQR